MVGDATVGKLVDHEDGIRGFSLFHLLGNLDTIVVKVDYRSHVVCYCLLL